MSNYIFGQMAKVGVRHFGRDRKKALSPLPSGAEGVGEDAHVSDKEYELDARRLEPRGELSVVRLAAASVHLDAGARHAVLAAALEDGRLRLVGEDEDELGGGEEARGERSEHRLQRGAAGGACQKGGGGVKGGGSVHKKGGACRRESLGCEFRID